MTTPPLPHYVRTYRRLSGLSQGDVAALLGLNNSNSISKLEKKGSLPRMDTAIGLSIIFCTPIEDLFAGIYARIDEDVQLHAKKRLEKIGDVPPTSAKQRRLRTLRKLIKS